MAFAARTVGFWFLIVVFSIFFLMPYTVESFRQNVLALWALGA